MRIAVVDDTASDRELLRKRLNTQLNRFLLPAEIIEFDSGASFLCAAEKRRFDLVFLDIYMEQDHGVDTARSLRQFNTDCLLVFTTVSADHALDGFRVRALQYFVKPYTEKDLAALFNEIIKRLPASEPYMEVNTAGGATRLKLREILYAEHYQHQIHIHTEDGRRLITRRTFREFAESIGDERFFLCGRGLIVNLDYAADFDGTDFILKNGKRLPVSRSLRKDARLAFGDFLFRKEPEL